MDESDCENAGKASTGRKEKTRQAQASSSGVGRFTLCDSAAPARGFACLVNLGSHDLDKVTMGWTWRCQRGPIFLGYV